MDGNKKKGYYESGEFDADEPMENDEYRKHMLSSWYQKEDQPSNRGKNDSSSSVSKLVVGFATWWTDLIDKIDVKKLQKPDFKLLSVGLVGILVFFGGLTFITNRGDTSESDGVTLSVKETAGGEITDEGLEIAGSSDSFVSQTFIGTVPVNITRQPLPDDFKENPSDIRKLALSLEDKTSIERFATTKGIAYIAFLEGGSQSAIFATSETLFFAVSPSIIDNDDWKIFIDTL